MGHFVVSFRVERDSSYQERYDSLCDKVKQIAANYAWDETTSFFAFAASGDVESVAYALYYGSKLNVASGDVLLVVDPIRSKYMGYGIKYPALLSSGLGMTQTT